MPAILTGADNMFMEVMHLLYAGGATGFILTLSFAVWIIILSAVRKRSQQDKRRNILWNILCFIPLAVALIHCLMFTSGNAFLRILPNYLIIYIPAALIALFPILEKNNKVFAAGSIVVFLVCLFCVEKALDSTRITNRSGA